MSNNYYTHGSFPSTGSAATSASMRAELDLVTVGFDKLPTLTGNADKFVVVNSTATGLTTTNVLPAATVTDTAFTIQNATDTSKTFQFLASGIATGTQRVFTMPDATTTLVGTGVTQTLTNKTLTAPIIATIVNTGVLTLPTTTDTLVGRATTDTLTNKTLGAVSLSGAVSGGGNQINNVIIGASTPLAGSFTTLSASSTITFSGGTANGVTYLNGSKVLTSGTALTFDGAILGVNGVSVGRGAGAIATNTAVGVSALAANTTGATNTAVGYQAAYSGVTATNVTAVGYLAANANTANTTTAIGTQALVLNTSGANNTAVGYLSLSSNLTGASNTAVGREALKASTGDSNTAIGTTALTAATGSNNTAIGLNAGQAITTGSKNSIFGAFSGNQGGLDIRTASNYIVLSDGDGNPRGVFDGSGNLGIGTTAPQARLQVLDTLKISNAAQSQGNLILGDGGSTSFNVGIARWNGSTNAAGAGGMGYFAQGPSNSGGHYFYTGDAVAGSTTLRATLDTSGNLGLGVTPSAWNSAAKAIQISTAATFWGLNNNQAYVGSNSYYDATGTFKYIVTDYATQYRQWQGTHIWANAASGTANSTTIVTGKQYTIVTAGGNYTSFGAANNNVGTVFTATSSGTATGGTATQTIVFTQAMTLDASGNLGLGTASPASKLHVVSGQSTIPDFIVQGASASQGWIGFGGTTSYGIQGGADYLGFIFRTNNLERMRLDSTGNLGIGTSSPTQKIEVTASGTSAILITSTGGTAQLMLNPSGTNPAYINYNRTSASVLAFYDNYAAAERMRLDASGNLGLAVTPQSTWQWPAFQIQNSALTGGASGDRTDLSYNFFRNGSVAQNQYISTGFATNYRQSAGQHLWFIAPSGTAGNAITFTQAMTLDASGNLGIGTAVAPGSNGIGIAIYASDFPRLSFRNSTTGDTTGDGTQFLMSGLNFTIQNQEAGALIFNTASTERMRVDASGNLGLGGVTPSAWGSAYKPLQIGNSSFSGAIAAFVGNAQTYVVSNAYHNGTNWIYTNTSGAAYYKVAGVSPEHAWYIAPSGTAGNTITFTQAMTLDASGNLGLGATPSAWGANIKAFQTGFAGTTAVSGRTDSFQANVTLNAYDTGSNNWLYLQSTLASRYTQASGIHSWFNAPSGTAGNTITFTQAMTLDASGNLLVGTTTTTGDATNGKQLVGGIYSTVSGSVSTATATATTMFTIPSTVSAWMVTVNISAAAVTLYAATYLINTQGGSSTVATLLYKGANISVTMSGYNVQVTQTSGVTQTVSYSAMRIA